MKYCNPILSGMHPDPSICSVEKDYYLVNSSFEYFPALPIFHSKDLIHWELVNHCLTRDSQITLRKGYPNETGTFAPTIRYHQGIFYVVCTNVTYGEKGDGNFYVWTNDPLGDWSDPIWLDCPGIDPSIFFDQDGLSYYTGTADGSIYLFQFDIKTGKRIGEMNKIWAGTGGNDPEGPHIYKRNGFYYLLISEGGTEYGHMITMARSNSIWGPYESCPRNPVLTNRSTSLPIKAVGHADLFCDHHNQWWAVCLGIRPLSYPFRHSLGRETMLVPVEWDQQGWPLFGRNGLLDEEIEIDRKPLLINEIENDHEIEETRKSKKYYVENFVTNIEHKFVTELEKEWNYIYNPQEGLILKNEHGLVLNGNQYHLSDPKSIAWIGRRQEHFEFQVNVTLKFNPLVEGEEAGVCIYMNPKHHYEIAMLFLEGKKQIILRRQIGSLWKIEKKVPYLDTNIEFRIEANKEFFTFSYLINQKFVEMGKGETIYLTTEVGGKFTGNYIGLYASGNGKVATQQALFQKFEYQEL